MIYVLYQPLLAASRNCGNMNVLLFIHPVQLKWPKSGANEWKSVIHKSQVMKSCKLNKEKKKKSHQNLYRMYHGSASQRAKTIPVKSLLLSALCAYLEQN